MTEVAQTQALKRVRMRLFTAIVFVFSLACSGTTGMEDVVSSSGPGVTLPLILVVPFSWAMPMAFHASELAAAIPETGGVVAAGRAARAV
jgi:hypothetical protein